MNLGKTHYMDSFQLVVALSILFFPWWINYVTVHTRECKPTYYLISTCIPCTFSYEECYTCCLDLLEEMRVINLSRQLIVWMISSGQKRSEIENNFWFPASFLIDFPCGKLTECWKWWSYVCSCLWQHGGTEMATILPYFNPMGAMDYRSWIHF